MSTLTAEHPLRLPDEPESQTNYPMCGAPKIVGEGTCRSRSKEEYDGFCKLHAPQRQQERAAAEKNRRICPVTYWHRDVETLEWTEYPCAVEGRGHRGVHELAKGGPRVAFTAAAARWAREDMERDEATSTASQRRRKKAIKDLATYTAWVEEAESKLAHYRTLQAEAQKMLDENPEEKNRG